MATTESSPPRGPDAWMVLNALPHLGPVTLRRLLDTVDGEAEALFELPPAKLERVKGVGPKAIGVLREWRRHFDPEAERRRAAEAGAAFIHWHHPEYPEALTEIYDPPVGLYALGPLRFDRPCVAIVGSRQCTLYGLRMRYVRLARASRQAAQ